MKRPPESLRMLSTGQAAEYLGVSSGTIRRWADAGWLQCYRMPGGARRILRTDLDNIMTKEEDTHGVQDVPKVLPGRPGS